MGGSSRTEPSSEILPHHPVLLSAVVQALSPLPGKTILDATFGAGGYSQRLLQLGAAVIGIDRDPTVLPFADALKTQYPERFKFRQGRFSDLDTLAEGESVDAVVLDIGVSSMQLDQAARGFSFMREGPLDMRMGGEGATAADLLNTLQEDEIANLLFAFGEERKSRRIAKAIVQSRPLITTTQLAELVERTVGRKPGDPHPATRSFQALRIAVNGELDELVSALFASERLLGVGGHLAVVTFHSIEDRIGKRFLSPEKAAPAASRHLPQKSRESPRWADIGKPTKAEPAEVAANPRARSATLRHAVRTAEPARTPSTQGLGVPSLAPGRRQ